MLKRFLLLLFLFCGASVFAQYDDDNRILNQFIIMLNPGQPITALVKAFPSLQVKKCLSGQMNIWLVTNNSTGDAEKFLTKIQQANAVKLAQFNHRVTRRSLVPNDPYFSNQWNMMNTGQGGGITGDDIDATDAWALNHNNITANGDSIVIAIVDGYQGGGFDLTHQDLNFYINYNEIPNNGIDDDSDGFVDDYYGWNAFDSTGNILPFGNADPHAMHVSGIAGAIGNNNAGVAGVCWGPKIMRVVGGSSEESQVVEAYDYVRQMRMLYNNTNGLRGAYVVATNSSFGVDGGPGGARHTDYPIWCAMYDSMGAVGILSAAATANTAWNIDVEDDIPTGCPSKFLIAVTNTTHADQLNSQAGWGDTSVDIGAPGTGIYSTETSNTYGLMTGTSMASPHLAGTVGAMFAAACPQMLNDYKLKPDSIALLVKQMILQGATRISALYNLTVSGGRLNLYNALRNLSEYNCGQCNFSASVNATQPSCSNTCDGALQLSITGPDMYSYNWSTGDTGVSAISNLCQGAYAVTITDLTTNCSQVRNAYLYHPDSIVVTSINTIAAQPGDSGNIIVTANAGNYPLQYSLDGVHYQQASTLVVSSNGLYNVYIKNNTGCVVERSVNVTSAKEVDASLSWSIYPNPSQGEISIAITAAYQAPVQISITDVLGQQVFQHSRQLNSGYQVVGLNAGFLAPGTYFISVTGAGAASTNKFIIAR